MAVLMKKVEGLLNRAKEELMSGEKVTSQTGKGGMKEQNRLT